MKYFFSTLGSLLIVFSLTESAWAASDGDRDRGFVLDAGGLYETYSNNNTTGSQNSKTTTTSTNGLGDFGYRFEHFYLGGTYLYYTNNVTTTGGSSTGSTISWLAPTVGWSESHFKLNAGYVATATDAVVSGSTTNYSNGTGWFASLGYEFYVSRTVYIAPVVAYYDVVFTSSSVNGTSVPNTKYEVTNLQPMLTLGIVF